MDIPYKSMKNVRQTVSLTPGDPGLFVRACSESECTILLPYAYLFRGAAVPTRVVMSHLGDIAPLPNPTQSTTYEDHK